MQKEISETENLTVIAAGVEDLVTDNNIVKGVVTEHGDIYHCGSVVLTTGTFLKGLNSYW